MSNKQIFASPLSHLLEIRTTTTATTTAAASSSSSPSTNANDSFPLILPFTSQFYLTLLQTAFKLVESTSSSSSSASASSSSEKDSTRVSQVSSSKVFSFLYCSHQSLRTSFIHSLFYRFLRNNFGTRLRTMWERKSISEIGSRCRRLRFRSIRKRRTPLLLPQKAHWFYRRRISFIAQPHREV